MEPFRKRGASPLMEGVSGCDRDESAFHVGKLSGQTGSRYFSACRGDIHRVDHFCWNRVGLTAAKMHPLCQPGKSIFRKSWRTFFWPLTRYRFSHEPLATALHEHIGDKKMGDFWTADPPTDVVITTFDLFANKTCFVKPWKKEYKYWPVIRAVLASSSIPTYFPVVAGRYVDGGVGSYANPCYMAAYEARFCLGWDPLRPP